MTDKQRKLIFVGGGGHSRSVADVALSANCKILGFVDPDKSLDLFGSPRLGDDADVANIAANWPDAEFVVTKGQIKSAELRRRLAENLETNGCTIAAPIISNDAYISLYVKVGAGSVVMHKTVLNANVVVGRHSIVNTGAIVEHDCVVGDFTHISTRAVVNGGCRIGNGVFLGSGSVVLNGVNICDNVVVGAGSVVVDDITEPGTYVGVPAAKTFL